MAERVPAGSIELHAEKGAIVHRIVPTDFHTVIAKPAAPSAPARIMAVSAYQENAGKANVQNAALRSTRRGLWIHLL